MIKQSNGSTNQMNMFPLNKHRNCNCLHALAEGLSQQNDDRAFGNTVGKFYNLAKLKLEI